MVQMSSNIKTITFSPQEREAILSHSKILDRYFYDQIRNSPNGMILLHEPDYLQFRAQIGQEIEYARNSPIEDIFGHLYNRLSPNPVMRRISEELSGRDFASIDDYQRDINRIMNEQNTRPDTEMGGLSPLQVTELIYSDWEAHDCPMHLSQNLTIDELREVPFFHNARLFLATLLEMKDVPTATEKCALLNQKITQSLMDKLILRKMDQLLLPVLKNKKNVDEESFKTLQVLRAVCECAGLVHRRKNQFLVKRKHQCLLADNKAGELYYRLFITYFRKYNLRYGDRVPELEGIQATIAYTLYRIQKTLKEYTSVSNLIDSVFLPAVRQELDRMPKMIKKELAVKIRLLEPLEELGLIECKWEEIDKMPQITAVRKARLLDRFVRFHILG